MGKFPSTHRNNWKKFSQWLFIFFKRIHFWEYDTLTMVFKNCKQFLQWKCVLILQYNCVLSFWNLRLWRNLWSMYMLFEFVTRMTFGRICLWFSKSYFVLDNAMLFFQNPNHKLFYLRVMRLVIMFRIKHMNKYVTSINKLITTLLLRPAKPWV